MRNLKTLFFATAIACTSMTAQAQADNKGEETLTIKTSAVCGMCKKSIEKSMADEKGVKSSSLDVDSQMLTVVFDSKKTNANKIRKAVNETGYDADNKPASPRAYNKLADCCKKN